jgi:enediyne polyketide synthase
MDGRPYEVWRDLTLHAVEPLPLPESWPAALAVPYLERRLGELGLPPVRLALTPGDPAAVRRDRSATAFAALLGTEVPVRYRTDGCPEVPDGRVSAAHAPGFTLAAHAAGTVAVDLEPVVAREPDVWRSMLGRHRFGCATELLGHGAGSLDEAATRTWAAAECVRKAGAAGAAPLVVDGVPDDDGWILLRSGDRRIATVRVRLDGSPEPLIVAVLAEP